MWVFSSQMCRDIFVSLRSKPLYSHFTTELSHAPEPTGSPRGRARHLHLSLTSECAIQLNKLLCPLRFLAAYGLFRRGARAGAGRGCQSHFNLELLHQFGGLYFLRVLFDLHFLLIHVAHGHIHARFIHGGHLLHLADHLVMGLADTGNVKLFHHVGNLLLPLGAPIIGNRGERFLRLAVFLRHKGLLHGHGLVKRGAGRGELALRARQRAFGGLKLSGIVGGNIVTIRLNGGLHFCRKVGHVILVLCFLTLQQGLVGLDHGNAFIHARHLVIHVADVLLKDDLRIFRRGDEESNERANESGKALPHKSSFCLLLWARLLGRGRCTGRTRGNWVLGDKGRHRVRDFLFFLLLFQPPAEEALFLFGHVIIIALNFRPLLGD